MTVIFNTLPELREGCEHITFSSYTINGEEPKAKYVWSIGGLNRFTRYEMKNRIKNFLEHNI